MSDLATVEVHPNLYEFGLALMDEYTADTGKPVHLPIRYRVEDATVDTAYKWRVIYYAKNNDNVPLEFERMFNDPTDLAVK